MHVLRKILAMSLMLGLMAGLAACAMPEAATRGDGVAPSMIDSSHVLMVTPDYNVTAIWVHVPSTLKVSEANSYFPIADIVWHGDPAGNRYAQVQKIFEDAFTVGTADLRGSRDVVVDATVTLFHALTQKARYTTGGMHTIHFVLTVRDAETGQILDGPRPVVADVPGAGGAKAVRQEAEGLTQKIVIEKRLAQVIHDELTAPVPMSVNPIEVKSVTRQNFSPTDLTTLN